MNKIKILILFLSVITFLISCKEHNYDENIVCLSPSEKISISFFIDEIGTPYYMVKYEDEMVVGTMRVEPETQVKASEVVFVGFPLKVESATGGLMRPVALVY